MRISSLTGGNIIICLQPAGRDHLVLKFSLGLISRLSFNKCICHNYLFVFQNVFVWISKCICNPRRPPCSKMIIFTGLDITMRDCDIWTNTFWNSDKYISQLGQIHWPPCSKTHIFYGTGLRVNHAIANKEFHQAISPKPYIFDFPKTISLWFVQNHISLICLKPYFFDLSKTIFLHQKMGIFESCRSAHCKTVMWHISWLF